MYNESEIRLGATPAPPEKTGFFNQLLDFATKGYSVFSQRDTALRQAKLEQARLATARQLAEQTTQQTGFQAQIARYMPQGGMGDWVMPVTIGAIGLGAIFLIGGKKKK